MNRLGMGEDDEIAHPWLTRAIANAQKKVEGHNFQIRKNLLEFDDVMNQQRTTVYNRRRDILANASNKDMVLDMIDQVVTDVIETAVPDKIDENFDSKMMEDLVRARFNMPFSFSDVSKDAHTQDELGGLLYDRVNKYYDEREAQNGSEMMRRVETIILLQTLDQLWKDNLLSMDHLKEGIGLRGYGQKDPLLEYKKEGFKLFKEMMSQFVNDSVEKLFRVQVTTQDSLNRVASEQKQSAPVRISHNEVSAFAASAPAEARGDSGKKVETVKHDVPKVGRNDLCPCGSGKKYKKCHGV